MTDNGKTRTTVAILQSQMNEVNKRIEENHLENNQKFEHLEKKVDENHREVLVAIQKGPQDYAAKWTESFLKAFIGVILLAVLTAILAGVINNQNQIKKIEPDTTTEKQTTQSTQTKSQSQASTQSAPQSQQSAPQQSTPQSQEPSGGIINDSIPILGVL